MLTLYKKRSPWSNLLISIIVPIFMLCLYSALESVVLKFAGLTTAEVESSRAWMLSLQAASSVLVFICGTLLAAFMISDRPFHYLSADRGIGEGGVSHKTVLLCCLCLLTALPFVSLSETLNADFKLPASLQALQTIIDELERKANEITTLMVTGKGVGNLLIIIFVIAIVPGICEELYFRGLLQSVFKDITKSSHAAIWITAAIFSFIHFQFLGFIPRMLLGALLGYILLYTGSIWVNATAHALNNALAATVLWASVNYPELGGEQFNAAVEHMPVDAETIITAAISTALCIWLLFVLKKHKYIPKMEKREIAIVCGGYSSEFGVSLKSAAGIKSFLDPERYNSTVVVIEKERWYAKPSEKEEFAIDKNDFSYTDGSGTRHTFDFAYITIHGTPGENGILQGYFELIGMKYSCCGPLAASVSFNKFVCNRYLQAFGAKIAKSVLLRAGEEYDAASIEAQLGLPMFVKSNVGGSSFGVTKVKESSQIIPAIKRAFEEGDEVIIESFMKGTEITCGMYKTKNKCVVFPITEVVTSNEFFDTDAKYNGQVQEITPARLSPDVTKDVQEQTKKYYSLLGCKGIVRIDYIIIDGVPHVLEANTTPGMTATSFIPQQVKAAGLDIKEVMTDIIENEISGRIISIS